MTPILFTFALFASVPVLAAVAPNEFMVNDISCERLVGHTLERSNLVEFMKAGGEVELCASKRKITTAEMAQMAATPNKKQIVIYLDAPVYTPPELARLLSLGSTLRIRAEVMKKVNLEVYQLMSLAAVSARGNLELFVRDDSLPVYQLIRLMGSNIQLHLNLEKSSVQTHYDLLNVARVGRDKLNVYTTGNRYKEWQLREARLAGTNFRLIASAEDEAAPNSPSPTSSK